MMYRDGKFYREVMLSEGQLRALAMPALPRTPEVNQDLIDARRMLMRHLDGPPDEVYDALQDRIDEGLSFRRDVARLRLSTGDLVTLEVSPDGDVDAEGRPIDCTSVQATWYIDDQRVKFDLDDESEVIHQWRATDEW